MSIKKFTVANVKTAANNTTRQFYLIDTEAELPNSGLRVGDYSLCLDTGAFRIALSATTWGPSTTGLTVHPNLAVHDALGLATDADLLLYQLRSEKDSALGYAGLDAATKVPLAEIPFGTTTQPVAAAGSGGAGPTVSLVDHVHAHGAGYLPNAHHDTLTIGADAEHSLAGQVLSGVNATATQKGHAILGQPMGLTGATAATRYVGATAANAPVAGTFAVGDYVIDQTGKILVCTVAGTPGTWVAIGGGGTNALLDGVSHTDTLAGTVADGDVIIGNITPKWSRLPITAPAANILEVLGVVNGETRPSWKAVHDGTAPAAIGTAAAGTVLTASHRDHVHATGAGTPTTQALGDAAATGAGPAAAMTDHKHGMFSTVAHGSVTVSGMKQTLLLQGWQPTTTAGCGYPTRAEIGSTTKHDITSLAFLDTSDKHAFLVHPMPDNWDGGTVTFRVWWYGKTGWVVTSSDGVAWTLKGTSYGDGQVIDSVFGTGITITDVATANNELRVTADSAALTIAGAGAGELIHWDISRTTADAADDWAASLELVSVVLEYGVTALST